MDLVEARAAYAERAWQRAYDAFAAAESEAPLGAEDYDRFAVTAHLLARLPDYFAIRERAYRHLLDIGDHLAAAEAALWLGTQKFVMGDVAEGGGWVARAARIVAEDGTDSIAAAFLNVAGAFDAAGGGDLEGAARIAGECVEAAAGVTGPRSTAPCPCTNRACSSWRPATPTRAWPASTRRCSASPPVSARPWSRASSTAA